VIDAHVHHWDLERFRYPWLDDAAFEALRADYLPADYRADAGGVPVDGWVHVQAEVDHSIDPVRETAWISMMGAEATAAGVPGPIGCVVYVDLRSAEVSEVLAEQCRHPLTRGVRQEAWFDPASSRADIPHENLLMDPAWRAGFRALATFGLSFDLLVWPSQLPVAASVAGEVPDVPIVLEHLGLPDPEGDDGLRTWRAGVAVLAQLPQAYVKLSAFGALRLSRNSGRIRFIVGELLELFGSRRCMVGSNFPVERLAGDFAGWYELILSCLGGLSAVERDDVLSETARRFYRLPTAEVAAA